MILLYQGEVESSAEAFMQSVAIYEQGQNLVIFLARCAGWAECA